MTTVAIDIGHGQDTFWEKGSKGVYVNGKGFAEHEFNAKTAIELDKLLKHNGFNTVMKQKPFKADVPLKTRTDYYNSIGVDLVWSIHANANSNDHVEGRCAFYWHTSKDGKRLAQLYVDECNRAGFHTHGNGLHASERGSWTNLHICRETSMVAVLTENGFMTNDRPGIDDDFELLFGIKQGQYVKDIARVHAKAICRYFNKTFKDLDTKVINPSKPQTKPESIKKPNISYNGTSVVDYLNHTGKDSSFSARKRYAKEYGVPNYKGTASQNLTLLKNMKSGNKPKPSKSISQMAQEIVDGKHGNGHANRRKSLGISQNEYDKVRAEVNRIASGGNRKSIAQMAKEVIDGKHGNGNENRRRSLGISKSEYEKVRKEVNKRL